jgi:hypothetical protein
MLEEQSETVGGDVRLALLMQQERQMEACSKFATERTKYCENAEDMLLFHRFIRVLIVSNLKL